MGKYDKFYRKQVSQDPFLQVLPNFLPKTIDQLLPENNDKNFKQTFVAIGPMLIDSLAAGDTFQDACYKAHIAPDTAILLLASDEFKRFVEAYLAMGDLKDRDSRIRLAKAILASQIANGVISKRKEPLDIIDYIRREQETKKGSSSVVVQIQNNTVPRPYSLATNTKEAEVVPNGDG